MMNSKPKERDSRYQQIPTSDHAKIPPQAIDLEEAVLGACLLESGAIDKACRIISSEMFYKHCNQLLFKVAQELSSKGFPVDMLTITQELTKRELLNEVGGAAYVAGLTNRVGSGSHIEYHSKIIYQMFVQREIIRFASELQFCAYSDDFDTAIEKYSEFTTSVDNMITMKRSDRLLSDILVDHKVDMQRRKDLALRGTISGVPTGFRELDSKTAGWQPCDLIIIAARPSMGKTAVALHISKLAASKGVPVCFTSLEMDDIRLTDRLICSEGGIDANSLKSGKLSFAEDMAYEKASKALSALPLWIDDSPRATVSSIRALARTKHRRNECGLLVIDYLQLIESAASSDKFMNREREVSIISRSLKLLAKELKIPVILLCQLNRAAESRTDKRPQLSDLRESGAIEQDADVVLLPFRPEYYGILEDINGESLQGVGMLITAKNRNGSIGDVFFRYSPDLSQIYDFKNPF